MHKKILTLSIFTIIFSTNISYADIQILSSEVHHSPGVRANFIAHYKNVPMSEEEFKKSHTRVNNLVRIRSQIVPPK